MNKLGFGILRATIAFTLFTVIGTVFSSRSFGCEQPQPGNRYKIVRPVYLMAVYDSLNNRELGKATARAYLNPIRYYKKSEVAFQCEVPVGTVMTVIGPAPKVWHLPFLASRYYVRLDPDQSRGLDVILELNSGMEGTLDGLNPKIFSRP